MEVVATGLVVRWEPSGYTVVAWHRHAVTPDRNCEDDIYDSLTAAEVRDVVDAHLYSYLPGPDSGFCRGWIQQRFF